MSKKPSRSESYVLFLRAYLLELSIFLGFCLVSMVGISYYFKCHPLQLPGQLKNSPFSDQARSGSKLQLGQYEEEPEFEFYALLTMPLAQTATNH